MSAVVAPGEPVGVARPRRQLPPWIIGVLGFVGLVVVWQILYQFVFHSSVIPTPGAIVSKMREDGWSIYADNLSATISEAAKGWLYGNTVAIVLAILFVQIPVLERWLMKFAVAFYCLPVVAIGPVLIVLYDGDTPTVTLAALSVFFATLISMLVGLKSADATSLDLIHAYGGGSLTKLRKVRLQSSLPLLFAGLRVAAPAAVLGAVIGEYLGGTTKGVGVFMTQSQASFEVARTWGIALSIALVSGIGYGITVLAEYLLVPWARRSSR
jgi:ABC-type nitrate/sulfonate/bicarbonate transport system permease component